MYYPYFRGKQYELITVRESAELLATSGFVPIIEPVKESLSGLKRALDAILEFNGNAILVINPSYGDHTFDTNAIEEFFSTEFKDQHNIAIGVLLTDETSVEFAREMCEQHTVKPVALIHAGFKEARALAENLGNHLTKVTHIFLEDDCGKLYRKHFKGAQRILLTDGFERRTNRKHPPVEFFSELHATFDDEGMDGYGDFLIVGNDYSETGGPAYTIAIHITFIDSDNDDAMYIHHFISDRQDTPTDPAGKFAEAISKLVAEVESPNNQILKTSAISEFIDLHKRGHYPGLGYVKKLSMIHHIETIADYFEKHGIG